MRLRFVGIMALTGAAALAGGPLHAQAVTGTVTYEGKVPTLRPVAMDGVPECAKKHTGPVPSEALVLGPGNTMGNILVSIKNAPAGKAPATPVVMDQ